MIEYFMSVRRYVQWLLVMSHSLVYEHIQLNKWYNYISTEDKEQITKNVNKEISVEN